MTVGKIVPLRAVRMKAFEASSTSKRLDDWERTSHGPNAVNDDADIARARSQDAVRNNPWIGNALDLIVTNLVGCGIQPRPEIDDPVLRAEILDLWEVWEEECDADGALDFCSLQTLVSRARVESGEVFVRLRPRALDSGLSVPLQIQAIEADLLPIHYNGNNGGNSIRQGIERSPYGQRMAYWFYREHPGDRYASLSTAATVRVPAEAVLHHYMPSRPGQLRGEPRTISSLLRARKLDLYESAELTRKQNRAKFNGAIYRETDDDNPLTDNAVKVEDGRALVDVEEGYLLQLGQSERVELYGGDTGNSGAIDFLRTQLRAIAAGMGVPYELMTGDYEGTNDRIMRVILNTFYRRLEMTQDLLADQVLQPVWAAFLDAANLSNALRIPGYFDARKRKRFQRCEWRAHAWSYVNPLQEAQTQKLLVDEGFESRSAIVASRGWDAEEVDRQQAIDHQREEALDLHYGAAKQQSDSGNAPADPAPTPDAPDAPDSTQNSLAERAMWMEFATTQSSMMAAEREKNREETLAMVKTMGDAMASYIASFVQMIGDKVGAGPTPLPDFKVQIEPGETHVHLHHRPTIKTPIRDSQTGLITQIIETDSED